MALDGLAHYYLGRWIGLADEDLAPAPPGYPAAAQFSLTADRLDLPVLPADEAHVLALLATMLRTPGLIVAPSARQTRDQPERRKGKRTP
jgi:hypothetical protein